MSSKTKNSKKVEPPANPTAATVVVHKYPRFWEWLGSMGLSLSDNRPWKWFLLLLLAVMTALQFPQSSGGDYDFFFHLKYGEIYLHNLTWKLDHSQFSWTPSQADWPYVTWVANILIYLFYQIGSGHGLLLLQGGILLGLFFLMLKAIHVAGDTLEPFYLLLILMLVTTISIVDIFIKPDLFSTLFFAAAMFIYVYVKASGKNIFYLYPPLFLLWVNVHGGFVNGLLLVGLLLAGESVNMVFFRKTSLGKKLYATLLLSFAASCVVTVINPYGYKYHLHLYENLFSKEAYESMARPLLAYRPLWGSIFAMDAYKFTNSAWLSIIFGILFSLLFIVAIVKKRICEFSLLLANGLFFWFGMEMARAIKYFPVVAFFSIVYLLKITELQEIKKRAAVLTIIAFIALSGRVAYQTFVYASDLPSWNYARLLNDTPQDVVKFIKDNKLPGPIFNDYLIGGYFLWGLYPDYKVFIDPRQGPYSKQVWGDFQRLANSLPLTKEKFKELTDKYPFRIAVIHYGYFPILEWFLSSPDWKLIYFDRVAAVVIHTSVIPSLTKQALGTEAGTVRFLDLKRAQTLRNLFYFYIHLGPTYARDIIEIYRKNVNSFYVNKNNDLQQMELALQRRLAELQQQAPKPPAK